MFAAIDLFLEYGDCDDAQLDCLQFQNCKFRQDFGPFKAGETVGCITFDFVKGICVEWEGSKTLRECAFTVSSLDVPTVEATPSQLAGWSPQEQREQLTENEFANERCSYCGQLGHWRPDCPQIPLDIDSGKLQREGEQILSEANELHTVEIVQGSPGPVCCQCKNLLSIPELEEYANRDFCESCIPYGYMVLIERYNELKLDFDIAVESAVEAAEEFAAEDSEIHAEIMAEAEEIACSVTLPSADVVPSPAIKTVCTRCGVDLLLSRFDDFYCPECGAGNGFHHVAQDPTALTPSGYFIDGLGE